MIRLVAIAAVLVLLLGPLGEAVVGAIEVGYQARESNTRLAAAATEGGGAQIVSARAYVAPGEE